MAIETEGRWGNPTYEFEVLDASNGVSLGAFNFEPTSETTEAENDATFQKIIDLLAGHEDLSVVSAKKNCTNRSLVTVTP